MKLYSTILILSCYCLLSFGQNTGKDSVLFKKEKNEVISAFQEDVGTAVSQKRFLQEVRFQQINASIQKERWIYLIGFILMILGFRFYLKEKEKKYEEERIELTEKIESLKEKLTTQSVASETKRKELSLDKTKIELAIDAKLGESSWKILNLIFKNPSISNKEIAEEVSLSLEGVSSSLRRMYMAFNLQATSNKKVSLIMKAIRISMEE